MEGIWLQWTACFHQKSRYIWMPASPRAASASHPLKPSPNLPLQQQGRIYLCCAEDNGHHRGFSTSWSTSLSIWGSCGSPSPKMPFLTKLTLARSNSISVDLAMHDYNLLSLLISGPFFSGMLIMTPGKVLVMETYTAFDAFSVIKTHLTYLYRFHSFGEQFWGN